MPDRVSDYVKIRAAEQIFQMQPSCSIVQRFGDMGYVHYWAEKWMRGSGADR